MMIDEISQAWALGLSPLGSPGRALGYLGSPGRGPGGIPGGEILSNPSGLVCSSSDFGHVKVAFRAKRSATSRGPFCFAFVAAPRSFKQSAILCGAV